jgi:hypothetical protein
MFVCVDLLQDNVFLINRNNDTLSDFGINRRPNEILSTEPRKGASWSWQLSLMFQT